MAFKDVFDRFAERSPCSVIFQSVAARMFSAAVINRLFDQNAITQYTRHIDFATVVAIGLSVVCRIAASTNAAFTTLGRKVVGGSAKALYKKIGGVELSVSAALVDHTAREARRMIADLYESAGVDGPEPPVEGYHTLILDGNHLGATEHRLEPLRKTSAGPLPGQSLGLLDPLTETINTVVLCEDAHAQERSLLGELLEQVQGAEEGQTPDLIVADRNFCTAGFLCSLDEMGAGFVIRLHAGLPVDTSEGELRQVGETPDGTVWEVRGTIVSPETGKSHAVRLVTICLYEPTEDGDTEVTVVTNVPRNRLSGPAAVTLYRARWTIEEAFNKLTVCLKCELNTLGLPKAALLGFSLAVCAYNILAVTLAAARVARGDEGAEELSFFYVTDELRRTYDGMMIALPWTEWTRFAKMTRKEFANWLKKFAHRVDWSRYKKSTRGPKLPPPKRTRKRPHEATSRLLELHQKKETRAAAKAKAAEG